jgi:hypothetical protein
LLHALLVVTGAAGLGLLLWLYGPDWAPVGNALAGMSWTVFGRFTVTG